MIDVERSVIEAVRQIAYIARQTLLQQGSHVPTVVLHTVRGYYPIVLPYETSEQKRTQVDFIRRKAMEEHAYAVTTVTNAKVINRRTGKETETIVMATSIQGGRPYFSVQPYVRDELGNVIAFDDPVEGEEAAMPGQMLIVPYWEDEVSQ
ncbi:MAG: hypothetical protein V2B18_10825 [Pseudomonadota bacterium]